MCFLTLMLSLYFSPGREETAVSQITLINKGFRSRDYRGSACGNFEKHHKISIFFALLTAQKQTKQSFSLSVTVALCISYVPSRRTRVCLCWGLSCNSHHLPAFSRCGWVRGGEWWLPARLCQHARLLPLPVPRGIQAPCRWAHLHR